MQISPSQPPMQVALNAKLRLGFRILRYGATSSTTLPARSTVVPAGYTGKIIIDTSDYVDFPASTNSCNRAKWRSGNQEALLSPYTSLSIIANGQLTSSGGPSVNVGRSSLVPGNYIPDNTFTPDSVGLINPTGLTVITTTNGATFSIGSSYANKVIENVRFECPVSMTVNATNVVFRNCLFVGNNPQAVQANRDSGGNMSSYGFQNFTATHVVFEDCEFNNAWWFTNGLSNRKSTMWAPGVWGGNFTLKRCWVHSFTDAVNNANAPSGTNQHVLIEASRLGPNYYASDLVATEYYSVQSGGVTHSDGFQTATGPNIEIRYSYIGGPKLNSEMDPGPIGNVISSAGNAALMIQQEPDSRYTGDRLRLDGINIHHNWLAGGPATLNLHYKASNPLPAPGTAGWIGNSISNNRFMRRQAGVNDNGYQIMASPEMTTELENNVEWDPAGSIYGTGIPVTIARV